MKQEQLSPHEDNFLILAHSPISPSHSPIASPPATHLTPTSATPFNSAVPYSPDYGNATPPSTSLAQNNPFAGFTHGPSNMMSPDAMLRAYATRDGSGSAPGTPMAVAHPTPPPPSAQAHYYPALDAPAQPEPVSNVDLVPGPPPAYGGRTLYTPGQERKSDVESRYSTADDYHEDAYRGYGMATWVSPVNLAHIGL
jgi:hypothetical protein